MGLSILLCSIACNRFKGESKGTAAPVVGEPSLASTQRNKLPVGRLGTLKPSVTYRRNAEMLWQDASVHLPLFAFDAIRTHARARAQIILDSGSVLDLKENSLIIINPAALDVGVKRDRAIIRHGTLSGSTENELWILTSAALLKIKATGSKKRARAAISVHEGKRLRVKLEEGEGTVYPHRTVSPPQTVASTPATAVEKAKPPVLLIRNEPVVLDAPIAVDNYGWKDDESTWNEVAKVELAVESPNGAKTASDPTFDWRAMTAPAAGAQLDPFQPEQYRGKVTPPTAGNTSSLLPLSRRDVEGPPGLTNAEIGRVIRQNLGPIRSCYESALSTDARLEGKLVIAFTINGGGSVSEAHAKNSSGNSALDRCGLAEVKQWTFPKPRGGGEIGVTYPFVFKSLSQ